MAQQGQTEQASRQSKGPKAAVVHGLEDTLTEALASKDRQNWPSTRKTSSEGSILVWKPMARQT
jgi:tRNA(Ile2) C34 agmatinyltransferase TiaS